MSLIFPSSLLIFWWGSLLGKFDESWYSATSSDKREAPLDAWLNRFKLEKVPVRAKYARDLWQAYSFKFIIFLIDFYLRPLLSEKSGTCNICRNFSSTWLIIWPDHCSACFLYSLWGKQIAFSRTQYGHPCGFSMPTHSSRGLIRPRYVFWRTSRLSDTPSLNSLTFSWCLCAYCKKEQLSSTLKLVTITRRLSSDAFRPDSSWPLWMASLALANSDEKLRMLMT